MVDPSSAYAPGPRRPIPRLALRAIFAAVACLFLFRIGGAGVALGGGFVAGGADVTAQLDSETRFLSAMCLGVGALAVWLFFRFERGPLAAVWLSSFALLGGVARIVSIGLYGLPELIAWVAIPIELLIPSAVLILLRARDPGASALPEAAPSGAWHAPGPRAPWARRGLQGLLVGVAGLFLFRFGLPGVALGGSYVAGGAEVTAQMDSEIRFMSALALGMGVMAAWLVRHVERVPMLAIGLSSFALLGGLMRLVSIAIYGMPGTLAIVATGLELIVPIATIALVSRRADA